MAPEQAIGILKDIHSGTSEIMAECKDVHTLNHLSRQCKVLNLAVEALEKQIPKKLDSNRYVHFCPECNGSVWQITHESNYCFRCGQKLDWEEAK